MFLKDCIDQASSGKPPKTSGITLSNSEKNTKYAFKTKVTEYDFQGMLKFLLG